MSLIQITSRYPLRFSPGTLSVRDGDTVYYDSIESVSSSNNEGSISSGSSVAITDDKYFISTGSSIVEHTPTEAEAGQVRDAVTGLPLNVASVSRMDAWDDFHRAAGTLSTRKTLPSGQQWNIGFAGGSPDSALVISSNQELRLDAAGASYMYTIADESIGEAGVEFYYEAAGSTKNAAVGLIASKKTGPDVIGTEGVATNSVHGAFLCDRFDVGIYDGPTGTLSSIASGNYLTELPAGQKVTARIRRTAKNTIEITTPDQAIYTVTDSRIDQYWGKTALIEHFQPNATYATDRRPVITGYKTGPSVKLAEIQDKPVVVQYQASPAAFNEVPTTPADVDGTNLKITCLASETGKIKLSLVGYLDVVTATAVFWSVIEGATNYGTQRVAEAVSIGAIQAVILITGLVPLSRHTYTWRHFAADAAHAYAWMDGPNGRFWTMSAEPVA